MLKHMLNANGNVVNRSPRSEQHGTSTVPPLESRLDHYRYHRAHNINGNNDNRLLHHSLYALNVPAHHHHNLPNNSNYITGGSANHNNKNSMYSNLPTVQQLAPNNLKTNTSEDFCDAEPATIMHNSNSNQSATSISNCPNYNQVHNINNTNIDGGNNNNLISMERSSKGLGVKEMLISLGLLCLVSLLLALLSLIFLLKISPVTVSEVRELLRAEQLTLIAAEEYVVVYEATLALCALTLSLNLCCLLVCAIQFLFAVKLVKGPYGATDRTSKYLRKSSISRTCAIGGFFISIPVFLTGIIMYTFIQFHSTPAIVTSVFIGVGIIFCGCAIVHNVFIWQKEKTNAVKELRLQHSYDPTSRLNTTTANTLQQHRSVLTPTVQSNYSQISANNNFNNNNSNNYASTTQHNTSTTFTAATNLSHSLGGMLPAHHPSNSYLLRPSTITPPNNGDMFNATKCSTSHVLQISGSTSPNVSNTAATTDINSVGTTNSRHELSTLV